MEDEASTKSGSSPGWYLLLVGTVGLALFAFLERRQHASGEFVEFPPWRLIWWLVAVVGAGSAWNALQDFFGLEAESPFDPRAVKLLAEQFRNVDRPGQGWLYLYVFACAFAAFPFAQTVRVTAWYVDVANLSPVNLALLGVAWCALLLAVFASLGSFLARRFSDGPSQYFG